MVLIVSNKWDVSVDFVIQELRTRGIPFVRLNTEDLPALGCTIDILRNRFDLHGRHSGAFPVEGFEAVWWRRPGKIFDFVSQDERPDSSIQDFIQEQWVTLVDSIPVKNGATWVNPRESAFRMENKILQLKLAQRAGFTIPDTLITNHSAHAKDFRTRCSGDVIVKALSSPLIEAQSGDRFIFTTAINDEAEIESEALAVAPVIFQKRVYPKIDYRVTVVGERLFAVKIESDQDVPLDWRRAKQNLNFTPVDLPSDISERCLQYVRQSGLLYGAIDLLLSGGHFYFLEINPNGEWGWLQKPVGLPIAQAIVDALTTDFS